MVIAADRPSILSPTTHANFFPHWMAGPLGGLWPGLTRNSTTLKYLFRGAIVVMYAAYLVGARVRAAAARALGDRGDRWRCTRSSSSRRRWR